MSWYLRVLKQYAVFRGRARRREYWMFILVQLLLIIALAFVDAMLGTTVDDDFGIVSLVFVLLTALPGIAVGVRRLHDTGRSGWWLLLNFIPLIGQLVLLVFYASDGTPGDNRYGPSPKLAAA